MYLWDDFGNVDKKILQKLNYWFSKANNAVEEARKSLENSQSPSFGLPRDMLVWTADDVEVCILLVVCLY